MKTLCSNVLGKKNVDMLLLQETFSLETNAKIWQGERGGDVMFAHGSKHNDFLQAKSVCRNQNGTN